MARKPKQSPDSQVAAVADQKPDAAAEQQQEPEREKDQVAAPAEPQEREKNQASASAALLVVRAKSERGRRRAGFAFVREPTVILLSDLSAAQCAAIKADPELIVELVGQEKLKD